MSSDLLRRAAAKLRETANEATAAPWTAEAGWVRSPAAKRQVREKDGSLAVCRLVADASYIELMAPPVALALADVLDSHGRCMATAGATRDERLEAVARAVLREDGEQW